MRNKNRTTTEGDTTMSDETNTEPEAETPADPTPAPEGENQAPAEPGAKANDQNKAKKDKHPVPEGWMTPVAFTKAYNEKHGTAMTPQQMYGYVKNGKDFPSKQNTDGAWIVEVDKAYEWFVAKDARKAERDAKKAEKAAKDAAKAAEKAASTPPAPSE